MTTDLRTVWEYISPITAAGIATQGDPPQPGVAEANGELYESWCRLRDAGAESTAPAVAAHVTPWALRMRD